MLNMQLGNEVVFPAAGYLEMAIEAIRQMRIDSADPVEIQSFTLKNVSIKAVLVVPDNNDGVETILALRYNKNGPTSSAKSLSRQMHSFSVTSIAAQGDAWTEHATGMIGVNMKFAGK
jgi:hypothetical protein